MAAKLSPSPLPNIPKDFILAEILPKLPAKSLLRFKAVCKSFNALISSPEFIRLQLQQSHSSSNRLLVIPTTDGGSSTIYLFDLDSLYCSATFLWTKGNISFLGSCNGLILISYPFCSEVRLSVLNPSTRTHIDLPSSGLPSYKGTSIVGFGFDDRSDDYKLVSVSDYKLVIGSNVVTRVTSVYSVNSKSWKVVDRMFPSDSIEDCNSVLINNHLLHWRFWSPTNHKRRIGCFDICTEKWTDDVLLPTNYYNRSHKNYFQEVEVLDGQLCCSFENRDNFCYDVWVMKEYGVQKSWIKLSSFNVSKDLNSGVIPVACRGAGSSKVLLRQRHRSGMYWYNKESNEITEAGNISSFYDGRQPYICNGSLVRLPDALYMQWKPC